MSMNDVMNGGGSPVVEGEMVWAVDRIDPSPYQRRTHFDEEKLRRLARSIERKGLLQRPVCRMVDREGVRLELVAGERRLRACRLAGMWEVPVVVRSLSDDEAREIVLIENLQREDLTPMEEARSFADLKELGWSDERIAGDLEVPLMRVRRALDLLNVPEVLREAVEEGRVSVATAALAGGIHDATRREELAREILEPATQEVPLNREQTMELIRTAYVVRVSRGCGFDRRDAGLVPVATDPVSGERLYGGSCDDCPHLSGNDAGLAAELSQGGSGGGRTKGLDPNMCTRPECFRMKLDVVWRRERTKAREKGWATLEGEDAERVFCGHQGALPYDSKYAEWSAAPRWEDFRRDEARPWQVLLKGVEGVEPMAAQHPRSGRVVWLVDRKRAVKALKEVERKAEAALGSADGEGVESEDVAAESAVKEAAARKEEKRAEAARRKLDGETAEQAVSMVVEEIAAGQVSELLLARMVFGLVLADARSEGQAWLSRWLEVTASGDGVRPEDAIREHVEAVAGEEPARWWAFSMAALLSWGVGMNGPLSDRLQSVMGLMGLRMKEAVRKAEAKMGGGGNAERGTGNAEKGAVSESVTRADGRDRHGHHVPNSRGLYERADRVRVVMDVEDTIEGVVLLAECPDGWRYGARLVMGDEEVDRWPAKADGAFTDREMALAEGLADVFRWLWDRQAPEVVLAGLRSQIEALGVSPDKEGEEVPAIGQPKRLEVPVPEGASPEVVEANAEYERRVAAGTAVSIAGLEAELGLRKGQLSNFRSNAKRLAKGRK